MRYASATDAPPGMAAINPNRGSRPLSLSLADPQAERKRAQDRANADDYIAYLRSQCSENERAKAAASDLVAQASSAVFVAAPLSLLPHPVPA